MFSSDQNVESIARLVEKVKHYIGLQTEYWKLDVIEKTVKLFAAFAVFAIFFVLFVLVCFYLSLAFAFMIEPYTGLAGAFAIIALIFLVLIIMIFLARKSLIERPILTFLANLFLNNK